ncbi:MAG: PEGA domain-containing protein [Deltaproteobacteria bacterium]
MPARVWFHFNSGSALALGVALLCTRSAAAQGEGAVAGSAVQDGAAARYQRGVQAFEEGRWREAVELFKQADELAPSALLSLNIAKVYERMHDNRSALAWYRDYLRRSPAGSDQELVKKRVTELEGVLRNQGVQQLSVLSTPPGATVLLDESSRGVTPWTGELAPGPHRLQLTLRGYADAEQAFELPAARALDLTLSLVPSASSVQASAAATAPGLASPNGAVSSAGPNDRSDTEAASLPIDAVNGSGMQQPAAVPRWWTWGLFGGSAALLLGSGAVELSRRGLQDEAHGTQVQIDYKHDYDGVQSRRDAARVLLGLGAALGIAGGVSLYFDLRHADAAAGGLAMACEPGACGVQVTQTW